MHPTRAALLVLLGATAMSFVGVLLRLIESADGFQVLFYRSVAIAVCVAVLACVRRRVGLATFLRSLDGYDLAIGVCLSAAFTFYIFALLNTSIASALFILSVAPFFAATLGWLVLGERPTRTTWAAMAFAIAGVGLMVADGLSVGRFAGNLYAMLSALGFACMLVLVRRARREDALGGTFLGGVLAAVINGAVALTFGAGLAISGWDLSLSAFMGAFTIGLGLVLVTWAAAYLPASEVSILVLLESVLGPIWVWLFLGETTTVLVIAGGAVVLGSVALQAWASQRSRAPVFH